MVWHVGDEVVEQATLPEQGMDAAFGGAGPQLPIHAEAFAGGSEDGQQQDGEGVEEQEAVAALRIVDPQHAHAHPEAADPCCRGSWARWSTFWNRA